MNTLAQIASLDGYGLYVWGSYGMALLAVMAETLALRARRRRASRAQDTDTSMNQELQPMKPRHRKMALAAVLLLGLAAITALVLNAFRSNLVFFYSPTQVQAHEAPRQRSFRLGGLVEKGSVRRDGVSVDFIVTDTVHAVPVRYQGILPDLFQEGKGVVAQGRFDGTRFVAQEVLAKHDENYMPPEAAEALKRAGESRNAARNATIGASQ